MKRHPIMLIVITISACVALSACGSTGATSHFTLPLDLPSGDKIAGEVRVASAAMEPDAAVLNPFMVVPWGKFGPDDLKNIEQALQNTITPHLATTSSSKDVKMDLHLVIRRYVVSTSNNAVAVLACVAWAATTPRGSVIYQEQFYASDACYIIGTIGLLKDNVHKAIVRRIAEMSLAIAQHSAVSTQSSCFEKTSVSFEEAASRLPQRMVSLYGMLIPLGVSTIEWRVAEPLKAFDWTVFLNRFYGI